MTSLRPRPLTVISWNTFLVPAWISRWRFPQLHRPSHQGRHSLGERAQRISAVVSEYDLVFLQEVWGVQWDTFWNRLTPTHNIPAELAPRRIGMPFLGKWLESIWTYWYAHGQSLGGLYACMRRDFPIRSHRVVRYVHSETASRKGIAVTEIDVRAARWSRVKRLVVFNTHLDVGPGTAEDLVHSKGGSQQMRQIEELAAVISDTLRPLLPQNDRLEPQGSSTAQSSTEVNLSDTAVILVGDYNMIAGSELYRAHLLPLREDSGASNHDSSTPALLRDLYQMPTPTANPVPREECASYDALTNPLATDTEASGRIDYILGLDAWNLDKSCFVRLAPLTAIQINVVRQSEQEVASDHYPVVAKLIPTEDHQ